MAGGDWLGIALGAGSLIGLAYCGSRLIAAMANERPTLADPEIAYGEWINVPQEARTSGLKGQAAGGGRAATEQETARPVRDTVSHVLPHGREGI